MRKEISIPIEESTPLSTTNPIEILERANELADRYAHDIITLNITSGPKSWAYLFGKVFNSIENVHVVYIDQNNVLWDYSDMSQNKDFVFDMRKHFRLYKNPLEKVTPFTDYTEEDDKVASLIEKLRKKHPNDVWRLFLITNKNEKNDLLKKVGMRYTANGSFVNWNRTDVKIGGDAILTVKLQSRKYFDEKCLQSPHAFDLAFNAGWFEYKVAKLFSRWDKCKEVLLNCVFPAVNNAPKNEVDVIVNAGTKIIFVECKTKITSVTDIDKFRSVVKNYGGMGSKGIFITELSKPAIAKEKCQQNGIIDVSFAEDFNEAKFFKMLDEMLPQLNIK